MTPKERGKKVANELGWFVDGYLELDGQRTAAQVDASGNTVDTLRDVIKDIDDFESETKSAFKGALIGVRFRDSDGAWHTLVPLSETPAEFLQAWDNGVTRMGSEYGKNTTVTDLEVYVVID